jgi:hypothetical protein
VYRATGINVSRRACLVYVTTITSKHQDCPTNPPLQQFLENTFVHLCYPLSSLFHQIHHQEQLISPISLQSQHEGANLDESQ